MPLFARIQRLWMAVSTALIGKITIARNVSTVWPFHRRGGAASPIGPTNAVLAAARAAVETGRV